MDVKVEPGSTLSAVVSGVTPLPVYRDQGLTQAVTLPYTLPTAGTLTLYVAPVASFAYTITKPDGVGKARGDARGLTAAATPLVFDTGVPDSGTYAPERKALTAILVAEVEASAVHPEGALL